MATILNAGNTIVWVISPYQLLTGTNGKITLSPSGLDGYSQCISDFPISLPSPSVVVNVEMDCVTNERAFASFADKQITPAMLNMAVAILQGDRVAALQAADLVLQEFGA